MKKLVKFIRDLFWLTVAILIWGTVYGLASFITLEFIRHAFFWAFFATAFFLLFHISDLKGFYRDGDWLPIFGRFVCLFIISAYLMGFIALGIGIITPVFDIFDVFLLLFCMIASFIVTAFYLTLHWFFQSSRIYKDIDKIIVGLKAVGVFWKS